MQSKYDTKLDRLITHNSVNSNYTQGFHDFIIDELELGARVAMEFAVIDRPVMTAVGPVRSTAKSRPRKINKDNKDKQHFLECYITRAQQFGWKGAYCTCLDWSPEI